MNQTQQKSGNTGVFEADQRLIGYQIRYKISAIKKTVQRKSIHTKNVWILGFCKDEPQKLTTKVLTIQHGQIEIT